MESRAFIGSLASVWQVRRDPSWSANLGVSAVVFKGTLLSIDWPGRLISGFCRYPIQQDNNDILQDAMARGSWNLV